MKDKKICTMSEGARVRSKIICLFHANINAGLFTMVTAITRLSAVTITTSAQVTADPVCSPLPPPSAAVVFQSVELIALSFASMLLKHAKKDAL
jgi:hypothetical protein